MTREKIGDQWYRFSSPNSEHTVGVRFLGRVWHVYYRYREHLQTPRPDEYKSTYRAARKAAEKYLEAR